MGAQSDAVFAAVSSRHPGLMLLRDAWNGASTVSLDVWQFALEGTALREAGLTATELRLLLARGLVERRREVTRVSDRRRRFREVGSLTLSESDCYVLSEAGHQLLSGGTPEPNGASTDYVLQFVQTERRSSAVEAAGAAVVVSAVPQWDARHRELRIGRDVIKRLSHAAPSQELILSVFQEEGWPAEIDDPLPQKSRLDAKRRLRQTAKNLNRAQRPVRLLFVVNPDGQSIRWQIVAPVVGGAAGGRSRPERTLGDPSANGVGR